MKIIMLSPECRSKDSAVVSSKSLSQGGFTLVEACVGILIFALLASSVIWGLNQLNYYATVSRLYTAAQTLAQNQIDLILSKGPYDPTQSPIKKPTPDILQTQTTQEISYYSDPSNPATLSSTALTVPIYTDPMSNQQIVKGTVKTTIKSPTFTVSGNNLNIKQATVQVQYTYRNKNFTVTMNTMRAPDQ